MRIEVAVCTASGYVEGAVQLCVEELQAPLGVFSSVTVRRALEQKLRERFTSKFGLPCESIGWSTRWFEMNEENDV